MGHEALLEDFRDGNCGPFCGLFALRNQDIEVGDCNSGGFVPDTSGLLHSTSRGIFNFLQLYDRVLLVTLDTGMDLRLGWQLLTVHKRLALRNYLLKSIRLLALLLRNFA